jgi:superfamily II DNA or RNA helicase
MSIIIPISYFKNEHIKKLNNDLHIKPIQKPSNNRFNQNFSQSVKPIEAFDTFKLNNVDVACLPFSYFYHHFEHLPDFKNNRISFSQDKTNLEFNGNLLQRQKSVRDEIFEILNRTRSVVLSLHTGFGKTVLALYIAYKIGLRTVILCHRKIIIQQWVESIKKYLPNATYAILNEPVKKKDRKEFPNWVNEDENPDFLICNVINVPKKDRMFYSSYGLVVVDEIHTVCTNSFSKSLLFIYPKYLIGLSATPFRSDGLDRILEIFVGPEIVYRKLFKPFNVYKINTLYKPETSLNISGNLDWNSILEGQSTNKKRNQLIVNLCRFFCNRNILVLVKRIEHANTLSSMLKVYGEDVDIFCGNNKVVNYNCRILIASYSIAGVGFDHPGLNMLIGAADVQEQFMQYIGRIFRRDDVSPMYIDMIDENSTIKKHSTSRIKICKEIGATVKDFHKIFPHFQQLVDLLN